MRRSFLLALCSLALVPAVHARNATFLGKDINRWRADLDNSDVAVRRSAAFALGKAGNADPAVVGALTRHLKTDTDAIVRSNAATALGSLATTYGAGADLLWGNAGPALQDALKSDASAAVRRSAAYALGAFGRFAADAAPALQAALKHENASVRRNAAWALGRLGGDAGAASAGDLCSLLQDRDALVRRDAAGALGALGSGVASVSGPALLKLVESETDSVVQKTALDALAGVVGPKQSSSAALLYPLLGSKDADIARSAAYILSNIGGEPARQAVPILRTALRDPDTEVRGKAALALSNLGFYAYPAIAELSEAVESGSTPALRTNAANALSHIGRGIQEFNGIELAPDKQEALDKVKKLLADRAVPALEKGLTDAEMGVRKFSAEALSRFGYPMNTPAIPALVKALKNRQNSSETRQRCVWNFFSVSSDLEKYPDASRALTDVLSETNDRHLMVRYDAARALAYALRADAPDKAVDVLLDMLKNDRLNVYKGTDARVSVGNEANKGGASVKTNLGDDARYMAAQALGRMGARASGRVDVKRALRNAAENGAGRLKTEAQKAITNLGI